MPEPQWLRPHEERAWRAWRRMSTLLDLEIARDLARDSGLSAPDYDVLSTLSEAARGAWRAHALAERLSWSTSRLAHHVQRMEQRRLVTRAPDPTDRRGALVALTDDGWSALTAAAPAHVLSVRRHFVDLCSSEELATLEALATRVVARLEGHGEVDAAE